MQDYYSLKEEEKQLISNTIITSIMNDAREVYSENNLQHKNAYHMLVWDFVGTRIIENLKNTKLTVKKVKRGRYSFDLIVDEEQGTAYTIMRKSNILRIKKQQKFSHYLWALSSINEDIEVKQGQMNLFSVDTAKHYREQTKANLLGDISSIITRYCTIVINDDNTQFPSIELNVLDMNLNVIYEEKWKDSLTISYNFDYEETSEIEEIPKLAIKEIENDAIKLKTKLKEENYVKEVK